MGGTLAGLPVAAVSGEACLPAVRTLLVGEPPRPGGPTSTEIASLCDPFGDLPGAAREIGDHRCALRFTGAAATAAALRQASRAGLLHLGTHARRRGGLPELLLADGPLTPADVEGLALSCRPVVVLSGCATAARARGAGLERSFAAALLRAGASAVVATAWPVEDREMAAFVAALVARWPFADAALAVRCAAQEMRGRGLPSRLWGGLVVH
jgi:CHAT domain-containing protein